MQCGERQTPRISRGKFRATVPLFFFLSSPFRITVDNKQYFCLRVNRVSAAIAGRASAWLSGSEMMRIGMFVVKDQSVSNLTNLIQRKPRYTQRNVHIYRRKRSKERKGRAASGGFIISSSEALFVSAPSAVVAVLPKPQSALGVVHVHPPHPGPALARLSS